MGEDKKIVVYFHGYGSSPEGYKTELLRENGIDTYAWKIDIKPSMSIPYLSDQIIDMLLDRLHENVQIYFMGTSLGAWYASKLAEQFEIRNVILINPAYDPKESLKKYEVPDFIRNEYDPINFKDTDIVYIGTDDDIIDFEGVDFGEADVRRIEGADHRFKEHFNVVIRELT